MIPQSHMTCLDQLLHQAILNDRKEDYVSLLQQGANPNACFGHLTLIELILVTSEPDVIKIFLDAGVTLTPSLIKIALREDIKECVKQVRPRDLMNILKAYYVDITGISIGNYTVAEIEHKIKSLPRDNIEMKKNKSYNQLIKVLRSQN
jgi:hypothetical protein